MSTDATLAVVNKLTRDVHSTALDKGFWSPPDPFVAELNTKLMLIVSEVSEAMETLRKPYEGEVISYTGMTEEQGSDFLEELMDIVIRTFDLAEYLFADRAAMKLLVKMEKNAGRPKMHGKRF